MKEISAKEKSFTLPWRDETWKFYQMYGITMKMKGLGARTLQFSFKQIFSIENDDAREFLCKKGKGGKIIWLLLYERINFNAMALKFSFQFEIEMGKKKQILFFDSKPKEATTERITQNMGEGKKFDDI